MIDVQINNRQSTESIDIDRLRDAIQLVMCTEGVSSGEVSLAVVDDGTIHQLNREYLDHDYATDVLSFLLESREGHVEGEVIVSADTAARTSLELGWPASHELLLYVIHGTLHLVGFDDQNSEDRALMKSREAFYLGKMGLTTIPPDELGHAVESSTDTGETSE